MTHQNKWFNYKIGKIIQPSNLKYQKGNKE